MKKRYGILAGMMVSLVVVCTYIVLALALCTITGYAAEDETQGTALELPIRENPVAASYSDYYVIREDGTLIQSVQHRMGSGFPFNKTVELMKNAVAVYAPADEDGGVRYVLVVDRDGALWSTADSYWPSRLNVKKEPNQEGWIKLEEDVSMVSMDRSHAVILKRDGSLWTTGSKLDGHGAPWLNTELQDSYYVKVMDNVIWAETSYYGAYAVTADHELWGWGFSPRDTGPEKLAEGVSQVSTSNIAVTDQGELLSWTCTQQSGEKNAEHTEPAAILSGIAQCGRGWVIKDDGTFWANGATWGWDDHTLHMFQKYHVGDPHDLMWGTITDAGKLQKIPVKDAVYAATAGKGMIVLDKQGTLWGIYDLNAQWNGPFNPFSPVRLMDGCYGAEKPAGDGMDNFTAIRQYRAGQFSDVKSGDWFQENVKAAYELGLMNGYTNGSFRPDDTITMAEAVTIAARVRAIYRGDPTELPVPTGGQWYQPYVNYTLATQVLTLYVPDYNRPATRAEMATLFARALPEDKFPTINENITFTDVQETKYDHHYDYVMWMAQAGIMQGKSKGCFDPDAPVKRSEAAAMLSRCAWPELRLNLQ